MKKEIDGNSKSVDFMSNTNVEYLNGLSKYFENSVGTTLDKLENFQKYVPRSSISRFLTKYEIFKKIIEVQGAVVECGVFYGGGLMSWAQLSAILEPSNHQRRIIGFDTFSGFPSIADEDITGKSSELCKKDCFSADSFDDLNECIRLYDKTRFLNHINKLELVKGDILETVPKYLKDNPHLIVSLLYLDADIYKPTKAALDWFLPRMPKGSIIAFDELNREMWPGETIATLEKFDINKMEIKRFKFGTSISYVKI